MATTTTECRCMCRLGCRMTRAPPMAFPKACTASVIVSAAIGFAALIALALYRQAQTLQAERVDDPPRRAAMFATLAGLAKQNHYDDNDSMALLLELLQQCEGHTDASLILFELAQLARARGDTDEYLGWLQRCSNFRPTRGHYGVFTSTDMGPEATRQLAEWHERQGYHFQALVLWWKWEPSSWCGTCLRGMVNARDANMKRCLLRSVQDSWIVLVWWAVIVLIVSGGVLARTAFRRLRSRIMARG